jgi:putative ABC transport system substrate-binding protein
LAASTPSALAAKAATSTIPIVFAIGGDPVRTGLVASLNRPGGNLTGAAHINVDTAAKRLELLHELVPTKKALGLMTNPTNPLGKSVEAEVGRAAEALGLQLNIVHASTDEAIDAVFKQAASALGGLVIGTDPLFTSRIEMLGRLSLQLKVPTIYQYRELFVDAIPSRTCPRRGAYRDRHGRWARDAVDAAASRERGGASRNGMRADERC